MTGDPSGLPAASRPAGSSPDADAAAAQDLHPQDQHPHDFDVQKQVHQQIRNDPDYDDWEYGTEPLPHEAWLARGGRAASTPDADGSPAAERASA